MNNEFYSIKTESMKLSKDLFVVDYWNEKGENTICNNPNKGCFNCNKIISMLNSFQYFMMSF